MVLRAEACVWQESGQGRVVSGGSRVVWGSMSWDPSQANREVLLTGVPLTGQRRSDGLRAHPKCVVIDSVGEEGGARETCGSRAANRMCLACVRRPRLSISRHSSSTSLHLHA